MAQQHSPARKGRPDRPLGLVLGPFSGEGWSILHQLAAFLRSLSLHIYTVPELHPISETEPPDQTQVLECSYRSLREADYALFVFLAEATLNARPRKADLYGGLGVEFGMIYRDLRERSRRFVAATLFDGRAGGRSPDPVKDLCLVKALISREAMYSTFVLD